MDAGAKVSSTLLKDQITLKMLQDLFHLPLNEAADALQCSSTHLKTICRNLGVQRWPAKSLRALRKKIEEIENGVLNEDGRPEETDKALVQKLKAFEQMFISNPSQFKSVKHIFAEIGDQKLKRRTYHPPTTNSTPKSKRPRLSFDASSINSNTSKKTSPTSSSAGLQPERNLMFVNCTFENAKLRHSVMSPQEPVTNSPQSRSPQIFIASSTPSSFSPRTIERGYLDSCSPSFSPLSQHSPSAPSSSPSFGIILPAPFSISPAPSSPVSLHGNDAYSNRSTLQLEARNISVCPTTQYAQQSLPSFQEFLHGCSTPL